MNTCNSYQIIINSYYCNQLLIKDYFVLISDFKRKILRNLTKIYFLLQNIYKKSFFCTIRSGTTILTLILEII